MRRNPTSALLAASLIALAAAAGWIVWKSEFIRHPATSGIAVLPFENLSGDPDNAYFADGIQEEILTRLASIAGLKVISRTSTQQYQSKPRNLREIAKQLGVANILEGSVQKAADQVRVNVQLINAQTDSHLWAETYDRKLTDILGVESEIAKRIAESLQAKLTGREEQALAVKPTNNPEAYDAYLRGLAFEARHASLARSYGKPSVFMSGRCSLTPILRLPGRGFLARTRFSTLTHDDATAARRDAAKRALENAQKLEPNSPKPCSPWVIINTGCCVITGLPKPRSVASAKCYQAAARSQWPSAELPDARDTGIKALPTSSKPSPWTHVMWSYLRTRHGLTPCFDNSRPR